MKYVTSISAAWLLVLSGCHSAPQEFDEPASLSDSIQAIERDFLVEGKTGTELAAETRPGPPPTEPEVHPVTYEPWPSAVPLDSGQWDPVHRVSAVPKLTPSMVGPSLQEFEGMALSCNPVLAQMSALVDAAHGDWVQTGLLPNPAAGYSGQQLGSSGQAEQQGVYFGQQIVTGKKLRLNREMAAWRIQRAEQELEAARLRVLTDVRIAYYDVLIAQRRRDLAMELTNISDRAFSVAQALFQGEEVSQADPLRARFEADAARIFLKTATDQHFKAWRHLTATVGKPELELVHLPGDVDPDLVEMSWHDALRRVLLESPEMTAAMADVEASRWAINRAHAEVVPDIDVQFVIQDDQATGSTNGNLQVSVPIPIFNRNQGGIQQAHAEARAAELAIDRLALDLQKRLATVFQRYESARNQVNQYSRKDGMLDNAERTLALIQAGYQAEEFGVLEMLTFQRTYFQTNLAYLDALREMWASSMEIRGLLLQGSLQAK